MLTRIAVAHRVVLLPRQTFTFVLNAIVRPETRFLVVRQQSRCSAVGHVSNDLKPVAPLSAQPSDAARIG
jgi:hypothetical protein